MTHFEHFTPLPEQIKLLGLDPADVRRSSSATPIGITRGSCSIFRTPCCMCNARSCAASMGAELPEPAHQRRKQLAWWLLPFARLRV